MSSKHARRRRLARGEVARQSGIHGCGPAPALIPSLGIAPSPDAPGVEDAALLADLERLKRLGRRAMS